MSLEDPFTESEIRNIDLRALCQLANVGRTGPTRECTSAIAPIACR